MEDVERLLDDDVCNNSVWSYRYFLLHKSPKGTISPHVSGSREFVETEIKYALKERLPYKWNNEACWVYVRGLLCVNEPEEKHDSTINRVWIGHFKDFLVPYTDTAIT